jgi:lipid II:glycine glycyltransferase (peptidoglycan interpeptide bridge formation enzyme)
MSDLSANPKEERLVFEHGEHSPQWDAFVAITPGGHHLQTSMWARVKASVGLRASRVLVEREGRTLGGAQLLSRKVPLLGTIAYVPRGPLIADRERDSLDAVLRGLDALVREERVAFLKVQPPVDRADLPVHLTSRGFIEAQVQTAPAATIRIDLRAKSDEELLGAMKASTRRNVRLAQRSGVVVRDGGVEDIGTLHELLAATGRRQGFAVYPPRYLREFLDSFGSGGHARLLIADHNDVPISAALLVAFGDTVVHKIGAWRGVRSKVRANELLHWTAIRWAKDAGYASYDFDGIPVTIAEALLAGHRPGPEIMTGVADFKLGFGGDVVLLPRTYDRFAGTMSGRILSAAVPRAERSRIIAHRIAGRG